MATSKKKSSRLHQNFTALTLFLPKNKSNSLEIKLLLISINLKPPKTQLFSCLKNGMEFLCFPGGPFWDYQRKKPLPPKFRPTFGQVFAGCSCSWLKATDMSPVLMVLKNDGWQVATLSLNVISKQKKTSSHTTGKWKKKIDWDGKKFYKNKKSSFHQHFLDHFFSVHIAPQLVLVVFREIKCLRSCDLLEKTMEKTEKIYSPYTSFWHLVFFGRYNYWTPKKMKVVKVQEVGRWSGVPFFGGNIALFSRGLGSC